MFTPLLQADLFGSTATVIESSEVDEDELPELEDY